MNREGVSGEGLMFSTFFFMLVLILGGIVLGVLIFYGQISDFREVESEMLFEVVRNCFLNSDSDFFDTDFTTEKFYGECKLNENILDEHLIQIKKLETDETFLVGVFNFVNLCELSAKNKEYPKCVSKKFMKDGIKFEMFVGSNQHTRGTI